MPSFRIDPRSVKAHFAFFGPVSAVALSTDNNELLQQLQRQRALKATWRRLHLDYGRARRALQTAEEEAAGESVARSVAPGVHVRVARRACERVLARLEKQWAELLRARELLCATAARPTRCTGHAVVVFRRMEHAERCVRHFELIRAHERARDGSAHSVDFRQLYFRQTYKLEVARAPEPSDIIWANLRYSRVHVRAQNVKTSLLIFLIACVGSLLIASDCVVYWSDCFWSILSLLIACISRSPLVASDAFRWRFRWLPMASVC